MKIADFFSIPIFNEEERQRISNILKTILVVSLILLPTLIVVKKIMTPVFSLSHYILMVLTFFILIIYVIHIKGNELLATILFILITWIVMTIFPWVGEGVKDMGVMMYILLIFMATLLTGHKFALVVTAMSICSLWSIAIAQYNGLIKIDVVPPINYARDFTVLLILVVTVIWQFAKSYRTAYERIQRELEERKKVELKLKEHQEHLEELINDRTMEVQVLNEELLSSNEELHAINERLSEQKKELENTLDKLKASQEKLIISEKMASLGTFTAGIAHEINNPVNFISAGSQSLFDQIESLKNSINKETPDVIDFFENYEFIKNSINLGISRTTNIITSLRNYAYSSSTDEFSNYNIASCIDDALMILQSKYMHRITILKEYSLAAEIECIPGKLNQVFVNIISNAIDAIAQNGEIKIEIVPSGNNVVAIKISDTGKGIDKEVIPKLFDPFYTTKDVGKGLGLGLYIVYGIIEQHKGKIEITSEIGVGTKVSILLPLKQV